MSIFAKFSNVQNWLSNVSTKQRSNSLGKFFDDFSEHIPLLILVFRSDSSHKLCVHTRLGDFVAAGVSSDKHYSEISIGYALRRLKVSSAFLFGN